MSDATYHSGTIYKTQPTSTGMLMNFSSGCSIIDENIALETGLFTLQNYGLSIVYTTGVVTLEDPDMKGRIKEVLFVGSTKGIKVKTDGATINNSTDKVVKLDFGTTKAMEIGHSVKFHAYSTAQWYMLTATPSSDVTMTLSSAT